MMVQGCSQNDREITPSLHDELTQCTITYFAKTVKIGNVSSKLDTSVNVSVMWSMPGKVSMSEASRKKGRTVNEERKKE